MRTRTYAIVMILALALLPAIGLGAGPAPAVPAPATFESFKVKAQVAVPRDWKRIEGVNGYYDSNDPKVSFQLTVTPMDLPDEMLHHVNDSARDQAQAKVKSGELASADPKVLDGVDGILTVETGKGAEIRRFQWVAHARGHYLSFLFAAPKGSFDAHRPRFQAVLDSVKFLAPPPAEAK